MSQYDVLNKEVLPEQNRLLSGAAPAPVAVVKAPNPFPSLISDAIDWSAERLDKMRYPEKTMKPQITLVDGEPLLTMVEEPSIRIATLPNEQRALIKYPRTYGEQPNRSVITLDTGKSPSSLFPYLMEHEMQHFNENLFNHQGARYPKQPEEVLLQAPGQPDVLMLEDFENTMMPGTSDTRTPERAIPLSAWQSLSDIQNVINAQKK